MCFLLSSSSSHQHRVSERISPSCWEAPGSLALTLKHPVPPGGVLRLRGLSSRVSGTEHTLKGTTLLSFNPRQFGNPTSLALCY